MVVLKMINYGADPREVERRGQKIMTPIDTHKIILCSQLYTRAIN